MRTIGLTGGIGSGKSYVANLLDRQFHIPVFNCDIEARLLTLESPEIREALTRLLDTDIYLADGNINKTLLADYMFRQGHVAEVNAIIHPAVRQWFTQWRDLMQTDDIVAIESAILVESGFTDLCDEIWLITAPIEVRIERAMRRDSTTREQVEARIAAQTNDDERKKYASHIICNDGTGDIISRLKDLLEA